MSNGTYAADRSSACYLVGGGGLSLTAGRYLPPLVIFNWAAAYGKGFYDPDQLLYTMLVFYSYFVCLAAGSIVADCLLLQPVPHPDCTTAHSHGMPSVDCAELVLYVVATFHHQVYFVCPTRYVPLAWMLLLVVGIAATWLVNGNYSAAQLGAGAALGLAVYLVVVAWGVFGQAMARLSLLQGRDIERFMLIDSGLRAVPQEFSPVRWSFY